MSIEGFTVYDMIVRAAAVGGDAPAVIQAERHLGFRELRERIDALAAGLAALGIARGERIPSCLVKVVDDDDRDVPSGTPGEIVVRGPVVFQGYHAQPDVTEYTFRNGWHHTGDVGKLDAEGYL
jgi:non-ribosomal peptide synthetase component E (peptide arylation enzyme)